MRRPVIVCTFSIPDSGVLQAWPLVGLAAWGAGRESGNIAHSRAGMWAYASLVSWRNQDLLKALCVRDVRGFLGVAQIRQGWGMACGWVVEFAIFVRICAKGGVFALGVRTA